MRIGIALLVVLAVNEAWACDDYSSRTVIGFTKDGTAVASRVAGERPGPGEWIRIETHELPSLRLLQKWDIVTRDELRKRLRELKLDEWVPENDGAMVQLRAKRWKAVEAELKGKGFVITPNSELQTKIGDGAARSFWLGDGPIRTEKAADYGDDCAYDLTYRGKVLLRHAVTGCSATGAAWIERAYLVPPGNRSVVLVKRGACADPALLVVPVEEPG